MEDALHLTHVARRKQFVLADSVLRRVHAALDIHHAVMNQSLEKTPLGTMLAVMDAFVLECLAVQAC